MSTTGGWGGLLFARVFCSSMYYDLPLSVVLLADFYGSASLLQGQLKEDGAG